MKKFTSTLTVLGMFLFWISCGPSTQDAVKYNDAIVAHGNKLQQKVEEFTKTIDEVDLDKGDFSAVDKSYAELQKQCNESIAEMGKMDAFDGKTDMKDAGLKLLDYYKGMIDKDLKEMVDILKKPKASFTDADVEKLKTVGEKITVEEEKALAAFREVQSAFAKKWNFEIK